MFERFTEKAIKVIMLAQEEARRLGHNFVGTEQILLGLIGEGTGVATKVLKQLGVNLKDARIEVEKVIGRGSGFVAVEIPFTPRAKKILELAWEEAKQLGHNYIGTEHLLLGLIREPEGVAAKVLETLNADTSKIKTLIMQMLSENADNITDIKGPTLVGASANSGSSDSKSKSKTPTLDEFSTSLTNKAKEDKLDPVIGREQEIERAIQILGRRTKNNPVLIGEPGVGKTAVAEGLAQRIVAQNVPDILIDKQILLLDIGLLVAGTKYRGEFEERLKKIMEEVKASSNIILVIDEIHTLVGAGAAEGAIDAANILKPVLSRGELRCIGATTLEEYRKNIEKDSALERRFQQVLIEEPSVEDTIKILYGLREKYEEHHGVKFTDSAIEASAVLAERYINDRYLPDKAIDLLDEAGSLIRLHVKALPPEGQELEQKIKDAKESKNLAVNNQDFERAAHYRDLEVELNKELEDLRYKLREESKESLINLKVSEEQIAQVLSRWTGIPVGDLTETETSKLQQMESILHDRVIGQDKAVTSVSQAIRRARVGLKNPTRPIGTFIFAGPTGVGKTELAKTLASFFFGSEDSIIRVDMSEFMERHTTSRLVGSPPGYVGYGEGGELTEKVRRKPYSVILFDEIEKAHPDVFNVMLQILDDGRLTDSKGRKVSFKNTIVIMTSNVGAQNIQSDASLGFASEDSMSEEERYNKMQSRVMDDMKRTFKPEFLNRIDEIIIFHKLNQEHLLEIFGLLLNDLQKRLDEHFLKLTVSKEAQEHLVKLSQTNDRPGVGIQVENKKATSKDGARPLLRIIQKELENVLAEKIVHHEIMNGDCITVNLITESPESESDSTDKSDKLDFIIDTSTRHNLKEHPEAEETCTINNNIE